MLTIQFCKCKIHNVNPYTLLDIASAINGTNTVVNVGKQFLSYLLTFISSQRLTIFLIEIYVATIILATVVSVLVLKSERLVGIGTGKSIIVLFKPGVQHLHA